MTVLDFAQVDSTAPIPATSKSGQAVNFLKIVDQSTNKTEWKTVDDWSQVTKGEQNFMEVCYLFKGN